MLVKGFTDFTIRTPDCRPGIPAWVAEFRLETDGDITKLFSYINAVIDNASLYDNPYYVKFRRGDVQCALYPEKAVAAPFRDRTEAVCFIEDLIDFLNDIYSKKTSIEPNHTITRQIPVLEILKLLPRNNCARCGFASCMAYADALSKKETTIDRCRELGDIKGDNVLKLESLLS